MKDFEALKTVIPQGEIAGVGEKVQYLVHEMNDNTVRIALRYPGRLSAEVLAQAVAAVVSRIDVLHASFRSTPLDAYWIYNEDYSEGDFFTAEETAEDPMILAEQALVRPIAPDAKTQMHCTLVQGESESVLVLNISHLCVDGGDGKYLMNKLAEAYNRIVRTGNADGLEIKNGSRSAFQVYRELSYKEFLSAIKPSMSEVKTEFHFPEEDPGHPNLVWKSLPAAVVRQAAGYAKERNATVNDLLLTACYRAYAKLFDSAPGEALSIMSMMDLRRHCRNGECEGLCNMSGSLPTVLEHGICGDFWETLEEIAAQTRSAKEDPVAGLGGMPLIHTAAKTTPLWVLLKVANKVYGSMSIGLTNMGNISCDDLTLDELRPTGGIFGGPLKKKPGMQISAAGFDGAVTLCCVGEYGEEDAKLIRRMLDLIEEELRDIDVHKDKVTEASAHHE